MKTTLLLLLACALILLPAFSPGTGTGPGTGPGTGRSVEGPYEYKFVRVAQGVVAEGHFRNVPAGELGEREANELAREGWVLDQIDTVWMGGPATQFEALTMVFRRPLH